MFLLVELRINIFNFLGKDNLNMFLVRGYELCFKNFIVSFGFFNVKIMIKRSWYVEIK